MIPAAFMEDLLKLMAEDRRLPLSLRPQDWPRFPSLELDPGVRLMSHTFDPPINVKNGETLKLVMRASEGGQEWEVESHLVVDDPDPEGYSDTHG